MISASGLVLAILLVLLVPHQGLLRDVGICFATASVALDPHYETIEGTEVVWQKPKGELQGVILAFHGCSHGAVDWWPKDDDCSQCIGLPVEVNITQTVLSRGYALVAISSRDRQFSKCWAVPRHPGSHTVDTRSISVVVPLLLHREQMTAVPLYSLGASSGGAFALLTPWYLPVTAVCGQIMALPPDMYEAFLNTPTVNTLPQPNTAGTATTTSTAEEGQQGASAATEQQQIVAAANGGDSSSSGTSAGGVGPHPPVLFVHMSRDQHTAEMVAADVELREKKGLVSEVVEVRPHPVTVGFLEGLVPSLSAAPGTAQQIVTLFKQHQIIGDDGMLQQDPRGSEWRDVITNSNITGASGWNLAPDQSDLPEVLNLAFAGHEIISQTTTQMLDWFEEQKT